MPEFPTALFEFEAILVASTACMEATTRGLLVARVPLLAVLGSTRRRPQVARRAMTLARQATVAIVDLKDSEDVGFCKTKSSS